MGLEKATPFNYARGTLDNSAVALSVLPKNYPQFLPTFFLDTQRGGYETRRVSGNLVGAIYGPETLNILGDYVNHASIFAAGVLGAAGQIMIKRLPYVGAGDGIARTTIWVTLAVGSVAGFAFERDANGTVLLDANGDPTFTVNAIDVKNITVSTKTSTGAQSAAPVATAGGFIINGVSYDTISYPIAMFEAIGHGSDYNNSGLALTALTGEDLVGSMYENNELAYAISLFYNSGNAQIIKNNTGSLYTRFSLSKESVNPATLQANSLDDVFPAQYGFKPDPTGKETLYDFAKPVVYNENIATVRGIITTAELEGSTVIPTPWSDFIAPDLASVPALVPELEKLSNLLTNKYSNGKRYEFVRVGDNVSHSAILNDTVGMQISPSLENPIYLDGGLDNNYVKNGDTAGFEAAVLNEVNKYADPDSLEVDLAINPSSCFIDSGYTLDTKLKLGRFLAYRKDVMLLTSTYEVDGINNDSEGKQLLSDAIGAATIMKGTYKLNPESSLFGTETSRAIIVLGSGKTKNTPYRKRLPLLYDLVLKLARFAGAGNAVWNSVYKFSRQPGNFVNEMVDIDPAHIGNSIKNTLWDSGLIWVQNEDRDTYFYPSTQTIYTNDTSVLNILLVNVALCYLVKQEEAIWREFTGSDDLSNVDLKILAEESLNKRIKDKFAGMYQIIPEVFFTQADNDRGYSYKLIAHLYANNMKTVQESYNIVHRLS